MAVFDISSMFDRFHRTLDMYCGKSVYFRLIELDDGIGNVDYEIQSFQVAGFLHFKNQTFASCLFKTDKNIDSYDKLIYIPTSNFENGSIFSNWKAAYFESERRRKLINV